MNYELRITNYVREDFVTFVRFVEKIVVKKNFRNLNYLLLLVSGKKALKGRLDHRQGCSGSGTPAIVAVSNQAPKGRQRFLEGLSPLWG